MDGVLYHYTSKYHLFKILKCGFLKLTESNLLEPTSYEDVLPKKDSELYKPVVWLTRTTNADGNGLNGSCVDKSEIRITVTKREHYEPWLLWSRQNRINKSWAKALERNNNPYDWYVSETTILLNKSELVKIENTITGEIIIDVANGIRKYQEKIAKPKNESNGFFNGVMDFLQLNEGDVIEFSA